MQGQELNRFADNPFPERSIGCERCHGPGADHIRYRSGDVAANGIDPIFNPVKVNDARRDAVCNQCHLQGRRRVVLAGRTEFDFQPGMTLSDNWIVFLKTASVLTDDLASAVSQVEQMYSSRCYQETKGQLGCITCHTGHELPSSTAAADFYRDKCTKCHSKGQTECSESLEVRRSAGKNDSCIVCHMPRFPAADVHTSETDHRILRRPATVEPHPHKPDRFRDAKLVIFEEPGVELSKPQRDRARGIVLAEQAAGGGTMTQAQQAIELLQKATRQFPDDVEEWFTLGRALEAAGQPDLAAEAWQQVIKLRPSHEEALEALATMNHRLRKMPQARDFYERLIELNPKRANYYGRLAHVLGQLDDVPRAIEIAEKCLTLNPSLVQTHVWLTEAYQRVGNEKMAAEHQAKIDQFQSLKKDKQAAR
jgi:Tfp pilus assembly protein PilF